MDDATLGLILKLAILVATIVVAVMVKKGWIKKEQVDQAESVANALAAAADNLKDLDPEAARRLLEDVVEKMGGDKQMLDDFLKKWNHNKPHKDPTEGGGDGG
jgi:hypothetical protein